MGTVFSIKVGQVVVCKKELADRVSMLGGDKGMKNILKLTNRDSKNISLIAKYGRFDVKLLKTA